MSDRTLWRRIPEGPRGAKAGRSRERQSEVLLLRQVPEGGEKALADEGRGRWAKANALRSLGDLGAAERESLAALELLKSTVLDQMAATATLAAIQLAQGRTAPALAKAEDAMARYEARRAFGYMGAFARLVHAEALRAEGCEDRAREAIRAARDRLLTNADKIGDPAYRSSFLEDVPENARTLALARAWLGEAV